MQGDWRGGTTGWPSHTVTTAGQEIWALVLALAVLSPMRLAAAATGAGEPLRISFGQTLVLVRSLWQMLALGQGVLGAEPVEVLVARTLAEIARQCLAPRRERRCARGVRQPVRPWPRLMTPTYPQGPTEYEILPTQRV